MESSTITRADMLAVADAVAREKGIEREQVIEAMEQAIQKAARSRYGQEYDIQAAIDRKTGDIVLTRRIEVVEHPENLLTQCSLEQAQQRHSDAVLGMFLVETLPPMDFGRVAALAARQVITQRVREAERDRQYEEYKGRVGEIINGVVKRAEFGNVTLDLGRAEALMRRDESIPREHFHRGDRVRAYIYDVRREQKGAQIFVSRTHPQFLARLFAQEVPEIYDDSVTIINVARDPGSRAKISVLSRDSSIDPVGACVGMRGSRVQAVVTELRGEKIDIIPWTDDSATYVVNALAPAEVAKVVMDEETGKMEVVVPDDQLSIAIGRRGQNVRLASMLTGWSIDILTEREESERRSSEATERSQSFVTALDVDDVIARLLVTEGFASVEEIAYVSMEELAAIEGFDESVASELGERARAFLEEERRRLEARRKALSVSDALAAFEGLQPAMLVALGDAGVLTVEDFAGLASDELVDSETGILKNFDLSTVEAEAMILQARRAVGWLAPAEADDSESDGAEEVSSADASGDAGS